MGKQLNLDRDQTETKTIVQKTGFYKKGNENIVANALSWKDEF